MPTVIKRMVGALALLALLVGVGFPARSAGVATNYDAVAYGSTNSYAGSASCRECHLPEFERFKDSHHALAERPVDLKLDASFFTPPRKISTGSGVAETKVSQGQLELVARGLSGTNENFQAVRVLGVDPLRQFLVPTPGGRFQTLELAVDPLHGDWFDIFGSENRQPGEWGHWTGRGMTWNSMCAACHNTALQKNYQPADDTYHTQMAEAGVGCEACHGPQADHVAWQHGHGGKAASDPTVKHLDAEANFATCGSCHSRRGELDGNFHPGEKYLDHYSPEIPDETGTYYPDGQIHEEDYEYVSFLGSRMYAGGVRCINCHDPHSGKTLLAGDALCLICHGPPTGKAPKIDALHSHHAVGTAGSHCVDCHMPPTTYMQRHVRRDHGLTIPDPLLTRDFAIPNACNRCHSAKGVDWEIKAVDQWYGTNMLRHTRVRAEAMANARAGRDSGRDQLLALLPVEPSAMWRAAEIQVLAPWSSQPAVNAALVQGTHDADALVRASATHSLETDMDPTAETNFLRLTADPVRAVRVEAAWALHAELDTNTQAGHELLTSIAQSLDQPGGVLQMGIFYLDRGDGATALDYFRRAAKWEPSSAAAHAALAVGMSATGDSAAAVGEMRTACKLAPNDAEYHFKLGLALNETGNSAEALSELQTATRLDPLMAPAWNDLGLLESALNRPEDAVVALAQAERADPTSARYPYARATILARLGRVGEAREAAQRALTLQPDFQDASELIKALNDMAPH